MGMIGCGTMRVARLLRIRRMVVFLHHRLRMARAAAAHESERNGQGKNEAAAELHDLTINAAGADGQTFQKKDARGNIAGVFTCPL